jgi:hypothetical protein
MHIGETCEDPFGFSACFFGLSANVWTEVTKLSRAFNFQRCTYPRLTIVREKSPSRPALQHSSTNVGARDRRGDYVVPKAGVLHPACVMFLECSKDHIEGNEG